MSRELQLGVATTISLLCLPGKLKHLEAVEFKYEVHVET